jgi:hypothetical protein
LACLCFETRKRFQTGQNSKKILLGSGAGEDGTCNSETRHDNRVTLRPKLFRKGDHRNSNCNPEELSWVRLKVKVFSADLKLSMI